MPRLPNLHSASIGKILFRSIQVGALLIPAFFATSRVASSYELAGDVWPLMPVPYCVNTADIPTGRCTNSIDHSQAPCSIMWPIPNVEFCQDDWDAAAALYPAKPK